MKPLIVIDPGHGGEDPGAVCDGMTEKQAALETALTLKWLLVSAGYEVDLTRIADRRPEYSWRTGEREGQVCLISVHYNSAGTYGLVYRQKHRTLSGCLAEVLARQAGLHRVWSTEQSRFNRLYIDDCPAPSILYEVAAIDDYPQDEEEARAYRIAKTKPVLEMVRAFFPIGGQNETDP